MRLCCRRNSCVNKLPMLHSGSIEQSERLCSVHLFFLYRKKGRHRPQKEPWMLEQVYDSYNRLKTKMVRDGILYWGLHRIIDDDIRLTVCWIFFIRLSPRACKCCDVGVSLIFIRQTIASYPSAAPIYAHETKSKSWYVYCYFTCT